MSTFESLPARIEAVQWNHGSDVDGVYFDDLGYHVITIHCEKARVVPGDWIVTEPDGVHHYPVKPEIFEKRWRLVLESAAPTSIMEPPTEEIEEREPEESLPSYMCERLGPSRPWDKMSISTSAWSWNPGDESLSMLKNLELRAKGERDATFLGRLLACFRRGDPHRSLQVVVDEIWHKNVLNLYEGGPESSDPSSSDARGEEGATAGPGKAGATSTPPPSPPSS